MPKDDRTPERRSARDGWGRRAAGGVAVAAPLAGRTDDGGRHGVVHVDGEFGSERTREEGNAFDDPRMYRYVRRPRESTGVKGAITRGTE